MSLGIAILLAWILGGVPFGLLVVRAWKGVDIRQVGSGNVGATNASRVFEGRGRLPVFLGIYLFDFFKGFVPAMFFATWFGLPETVDRQVALGAAAVLGHCVSPFLGLKGGKGVATTTGVFAAVEPIALVASLVVFGIVARLTRQVFWGSLALGLTLGLAVPLREPSTAFSDRWAVSVAAITGALFLLYTHRSNLRQFFVTRREAKV
ncbi:MAG: glycerol-3-phosphate acyltransferase [Planctomycetota bacterium]